MKHFHLTISFILLCGSLAFAQVHVGWVNYEKRITNRMLKDLEQWAKPEDEYETQEAYTKRTSAENVRKKGDELVKKYTTEYMNEYRQSLNYGRCTIEGKFNNVGKFFVLYLDSLHKGNTYFSIAIHGSSTEELRQKGDQFKQNIRNGTFNIKRDSFILQNGEWMLAYIELEMQTYRGKTIAYSYDISKDVSKASYNTLAANPIVDVNRIIELFNGGVKGEDSRENTNLDPEMNILSQMPKKPLGTNKDAFALIIGNKNYVNMPLVNYAINDAEVFKKYLINVWGIPTQNIEYVEDANIAKLNLCLGQGNNDGSFTNRIKSTSDIFVFYSGHGMTELSNKSAYLMPVEADPKDVKNSCLEIEILLDKLRKKSARSKTIILDACFANTRTYIPNSGFIVTPRPNDLNDPTMTLISAADGYAYWYKAKEHGLLTYFIFKAICDKENSDTNSDGMLSVEELKNYLNHPEKGIPYYSRNLVSQDQKPAVQTANPSRIFVSF